MGLYAHFVDFEKAFDSAHRESPWNMMGIYGIPGKMVRAIVGISTLQVATILVAMAPKILELAT